MKTEDFENKLDGPFDILHSNALELIKYEEDRQILSSQSKNRK